MATQDPLEEAARQLLRERVGYPKSTSMREVDRALGKHLSYTSRLLSGSSRLRFDQVSEILEAVGEAPATFLAELARRVAGNQDARVAEARREFASAFDPEHVIERMGKTEERLRRLEEEFGLARKKT